MLNETQSQELRTILEGSLKPLFLFHDDPDGSTSFMQLLTFRGEGKGIIIKTGPHITSDMVRKVKEYGPDRVFVLDIALVDEDFIRECGIPVVWIDHHGLEPPHGSTYINPRAWGQTTPPCYMSYQITEKKNPWLAMIGCVGDWFMPPQDLISSFTVRYPGLIEGRFSLPEELLFKSKIGVLVQMLSFNLKGSSQDAMTAIKIFMRLEGPAELLEESTPQSRWLIRRYRKIKTLYDELKREAVLAISSQSGLVRTFSTTKDRFAISKDLSNELSYLFPDKVIVSSREKDGEMKISIRSGRDGPVIDTAVGQALAGLDAHGGGHEKACGANVKKIDFEHFIKRLKDGLQGK